MICLNLSAIYHDYKQYEVLKIYIDIIYDLTNPKKNPKVVSKLPIPVYLTALPNLYLLK